MPLGLIVAVGLVAGGVLEEQAVRLATRAGALTEAELQVLSAVPAMEERRRVLVCRQYRGWVSVPSGAGWLGWRVGGRAQPQRSPAAPGASSATPSPDKIRRRPQRRTRGSDAALAGKAQLRAHCPSHSCRRGCADRAPSWSLAVRSEDDQRDVGGASAEELLERVDVLEAYAVLERVYVDAGAADRHEVERCLVLGLVVACLLVCVLMLSPL